MEAKRYKVIYIVESVDEVSARYLVEEVYESAARIQDRFPETRFTVDVREDSNEDPDRDGR